MTDTQMQEAAQDSSHPFGMTNNSIFSIEGEHFCRQATLLADWRTHSVRPRGMSHAKYGHNMLCPSSVVKGGALACPGSWPEWPCPPLKKGFSLVEILLSLLILSGTLVSLLSGIQAAQKLSHYANFEELAAFFAEREMEVLKADLLAGRRLGEKVLTTQGRFKLPTGWKTSLRWSLPNELGLRRLVCQVLRGSEQFALESFLFCPIQASQPVLPPAKTR